MGSATFAGRSLAALGTAALACAVAVLPVAARAAAGGTGSSCRGANLRPSATDLRAVDAAALCLVNRARAAHGLRSLRANGALAGVAAGKVASMIRGDYFADVGPSGRTPLSLVAHSAYGGRTARVSVGENIAWGNGSYATPAHVIGEWLASAPHRAVLLGDEYRDAGVAVAALAPAILHARGHAATYVLELGARDR